MSIGQNDLLLEIKNLTVGFNGSHKGMPVVRGINIDVRAGEILGIVGRRERMSSLFAQKVCW